jgi:hypothetical protein
MLYTYGVYDTKHILRASFSLLSGTYQILGSNLVALYQNLRDLYYVRFPLVGPFNRFHESFYIK